MIICYISEYNFYVQDWGHSIPLFLDPSGFRDFMALGGDTEDSFTSLANGFVGYFCPLYRCRSSLNDKLFATRITDRINQALREAKGKAGESEAEKAKAFASSFSVGPL